MPTAPRPDQTLEERLEVSDRTGFWFVAYTFAVIMAFSTLPTPLYVLYARRDGFSAFMVTVVFAAYAVGVAASLLLAGHVSDVYGRRRTLVPATTIAAGAGLVFIFGSSLPALLIGRLVSGFAVGVVTASATAHLAELHHHDRRQASPRRAELVAVAANLRGLGLGSLISGLLAQFGSDPLQLPYLVFEVLLVVAAIAFALAPETTTRPVRRVRYRPQRIAVPPAGRARFGAAALGGCISFATFGLFSSLAPGFLAGALHEPSHALAGAVAFAVFGAAAIGQIALRGLTRRQTLLLGAAFVPAGLGLVAAGMSLAALAPFIAGTLITGTGAGLIFKGALTASGELAPPGARAEVLAAFFLASYVGLAVPVIAVGAVAELISAQVDVAVFAAVATALLVPVVRRLAGGPQPAVALEPAPPQKVKELV